MHYSSNLNSDSTGVSPIKNEHFFSYRARITYNNEDNWIFPTRGARFNAGYVYLTTDFARLEEYSPMGTYLGKKTGLSIVNADWRISIPFGARLTIQPMFYGRLLFGSVVPHIFSNTIGGDWFGHYMEQQMPFAGVGCMEYVENQFVAAQLQAQRLLLQHDVRSARCHLRLQQPHEGGLFLHQPRLRILNRPPPKQTRPR